MAHFTVVVTAPVPAGVAWARVFDLAAHSEVIPFTSVGGESLTAGELVPGSRFVARTALGALGFDDAMTVEVWRAPTGRTPGFARIRKEGNVVRGWIDLVVAGDGAASRSRVMWSQVIRVRGVPRALDPFVAVCGRAAYGWALRRLVSRNVAAPQ